MAGDAGRQEDHARPTLNETQPLTDITNETVDDPPKTIPTEDNRDQPPPSNETATNKDKRRTTQEDQYRPATATPSLFTQHSVDSGIGDEDEVASGQHQHDAIDQQPNNTGGNDGQEAPLVTTGYEDLNTTQDQPGGQHGALAGEQLAREQDLVADEFDSDSALGSDTESMTTSLSESIWNYRQEHGRTYHAYKDGKYIFPNDEVSRQTQHFGIDSQPRSKLSESVNAMSRAKTSGIWNAGHEREADRLDLQHHLFRMTFAEHLYFAPLHQPKRALDVGTGTGIWAIEFADEFPDCQVTGIDLSPGQPNLWVTRLPFTISTAADIVCSVPPNCRFVVDDAEDLWLYEGKFDYIHARLMAGCFADWPTFFRQAYENLEPGGWLEIQDYGLPVKSADGTANGTDLMRWGELLCEAARALGRPMGSDCADHYLTWMADAGFVEIQQHMFMWPSNTWPKDPLMKQLGQWNQINILDGLEGFCLALLTRGLGWKKEEVDIFVARVSRDLKDKRIHAYFPMPVTYARKPYPGKVPFSMR